MSVNNMGFEQSAGVLQSIVNQMGGINGNTVSVDTTNYVSVGQTALKTGYDPLLGAISQVLTKTIFSVRPYNAKLSSMFVDSTQWGAITRKINYLDRPIDSLNESFPAKSTGTVEPLVDKTSVDMYKIKKVATSQLNFYGENVYQDHITFFGKQLEAAFTDPAQMAQFWSGAITQLMNKLEMFKDGVARATLLNMMAGRLKMNEQNGTIIHLLTEYKAQTGNTTITAANWKSQAQVEPFARWLDARLKTLIGLMSERSTLYHSQVPFVGRDTVVSDEEPKLYRATNNNDMKMYMLADVVNTIDSEVLNTFIADYNKILGDFTPINYWQNIQKPGDIDVTSVTMNPTTGAAENQENLKQSNIIGFIADRDALGVTLMDNYSLNTPMNAAGRYYNQYIGTVAKWWNSFDENFVVLCLD